MVECAAISARRKLSAAVLLGVVWIATVLVVSASPAVADTEAVEIQGWIVDEKCGAQNANPDGEQCATDCFEAGSRLVFYDETSEKIYQIDDQELAAKHIGLVKIMGRIVGETVEVEAIEAVV